jgi:hypothetical protein
MADDRRRPLEFLAAAVLGGLVGGAVAAKFGSPAQVAPQPDSASVSTSSPHEPPPDPRDALGADDGLGPDDGRVLALERKVALLERVLAKRRAKQADAGSDEGDVRPPADPEDPEFELAVRTIVDRANEQREQEREDVRDERRQERVARRVDELTEKLGLDDDQVDKVETILLEQFEAFSELRSGDERPVTRTEWRERRQAIRGETNNKLGEVLDETQLSSYAKLQEEEGNGRRRRRRQ